MPANELLTVEEMYRADAAAVAAGTAGDALMEAAGGAVPGTVSPTVLPRVSPIFTWVFPAKNGGGKMRIKTIIAFVSLSIFVTTGCSNIYEPRPLVTVVKDELAISNTASISYTLILDKKGAFVTCTLPQPDASFNQSEEGDINVSLLVVGGGKDSDKTGEAEKSGETEMVGRTPAVLMARELFFRLCEFSRNYDLTKNDAMALYRMTLDAVKEVWKTEASKTTITIGEKLTTTQTEKSGDALPSLGANTTTQ